jgi:hypothetical protein
MNYRKEFMKQAVYCFRYNSSLLAHYTVEAVITIKIFKYQYATQQKITEHY